MADNPEQLPLIPPVPYPEPSTGDLPLALLEAQARSAPFDKGLARSLRRYGQFSRITVQRTGDVYKIADGRRRVKALIHNAEEDGVSLTDAIVRADIYEMNDATFAPIATLITNNERSANVVSELEAIERLLATARSNGGLVSENMSEKVLAEALGLPVQTLRKRMALLNLHADLRAALSDGRLAPSVAHMAAKLPNDLQEELAQAARQGAKVTGADVRTMRLVQVRDSVTTLELPMTPGAGEAPVMSSVPDEELIEWIEKCDRENPHFPLPSLQDALQELLEWRMAYSARKLA